MTEPTRLVDIPDILGITYRQADYWTRTGLIGSRLISQNTGAEAHPRFRENGYCGTGMVKVIDADELEVMTLMSDLIKAGMLPKPAAALSRRLLDEPCGEVTIGRILLTYRPEQVTTA